MVQKNRMKLITLLGTKTKWLSVFVLLIVGYALITVYNGFRAEVLHNDLCKKEQLILNYIAVGSTEKAQELLKELEHPSNAAAPLISRDSIVSWKTYWVAKRNYLEQQLIEGKSIQNNQK
jgi:hypothetical protein